MNERITYYSTNGVTEKVSFGEALLKGLAPDGGLYMPDRIPVIQPDQLRSLAGKPYPDIAFVIGRNLLAGDVPEPDLYRMVREAYDFEVPLENVFERKYIMRLDHGPTASFKDFAARLMGRLMQHFLEKQERNMLILTATSGDTGSAIANAFYGLGNIRVVILFPKNEVTPTQRKQMTTLRKNIQIIAVDGKFDDCQAMVKRAFTDPELSGLGLSSANSINIGRLLPQSFYYFYAWAQLSGNPDESLVFAVPSGNFGNMMGGLLAKSMGLPVKHFVVATNENDEVPVYWQTGRYNPVIPSRNCVSSAMNVGHPSNMARVINLYGGQMDEKGNITRDPDIHRLYTDVTAVSISDRQTLETLQSLYRIHGVLTEPHGAAGWAGLMAYFENHPGDAAAGQLAVCLETAHPAKFPERIIELLRLQPPLPKSLEGLSHIPETYVSLNNDYEQFKSFLQSLR